MSHIVSSPWGTRPPRDARIIRPSTLTITGTWAHRSDATSDTNLLFGYSAVSVIVARSHFNSLPVEASRPNLDFAPHALIAGVQTAAVRPVIIRLRLSILSTYCS